MPLKDKAARNSYQLAYHHKRKLTDPNWLKVKAARIKKWREENTEQEKNRRRKQNKKLTESGYFRKWHAENSDKCAQYTRACKKRHPERYKQRKRKWYRNNPEKAKAQKERTYKKTYQKWLYRNATRRARKRNAQGSHTIEQWFRRVEYYGWRCFYCKRELSSRTLTKDHRIALSVGGTDFASNLVPACGRCN